MTTRQSEKVKQGRRRPVFIPDPPKHKAGEMTSFDHLSLNGNAYFLKQHLGNPETTIVRGERYLLATPRVPAREKRIPDLLIAFNADPELYRANNSYIISEQGKPPDFVLEVASRGTGRRDRWAKREDYLAMEIPEYWRFDETGNYHGARLGGDLLVEGQYQPIPIETLAEDILQGYSPALNLYIRWERGELRWHDPATGQHIATFEQEREDRQQAEQGRLQEREARLAAEARVRELEAELERRQRP